MLYQTIGTQLEILLSFIFVGLLFGVIYDLVKLLRYVFVYSFSSRFISMHINNEFKNISNPLINKEKKIFHNIKLFLFDVLYFLIITPICVIFVYEFNDGIIRIFILVGILVGFLIYRLTLGRLTSLAFQYIAYYVKILLSYLTLLLKKPIRKLFIKYKEKANKRVKKSDRGKKILLKYGK